MPRDQDTSPEGDGTDELTSALLPTVEKAIRISVRRNPKPLVDAIFPVIGPATRKAIAQALRSMVQSLSRSLDNSLSLRGLKWRFQSIRTGRPFAEIVLLNTLVFRVEQVFLIHRKTGLLLTCLESDETRSGTQDMVSGMLTAIRDFVRDSFGPADGGNLETIRVGDVNVLVEDGPEAVLAVVVRGNTPESFGELLAGVQEELHGEFRAELAVFDGDVADFERSRPILERCLIRQEKVRSRKTNPLLYVAAAVIFLAAGYAVWHGVRSQSRWDAMADEVSRLPGVMLVQSRRDGGGGVLRGVRDPLQADVERVIESHGYDLASVSADWVPVAVDYLPFVRSRVIAALDAPAGVTVEVGENRIVKLKGDAPHGWIVSVGAVSRHIPGVAGIDVTGLVDRDRKTVCQQASIIQAYRHRFDVASSAPDLAETAEAAGHVELLFQAARAAGIDVHLVVTGRADATGTDSKNSVLSHERAIRVRQALIDAGVPGHRITAEGVGTVPLESVKSGHHNRCVTYGVIMEAGCE